MKDPIARARAVADRLRDAGLPATQVNIEDAFRALDDAALRTGIHQEMKMEDYSAPNAFERDLKILRAAMATEASRADDAYKAARLRDLAAEDLDTTPLRALSAEDLREYESQNPYEQDIKALQMQMVLSGHMGDSSFRAHR